METKKLQTIFEAVNQLEDFLLSDLQNKKEWDTEFIENHFNILRKQIRELEKEEKDDTR